MYNVYCVDCRESNKRKKCNCVWPMSLRWCLYVYNMYIHFKEYKKIIIICLFILQTRYKKKMNDDRIEIDRLIMK